MPRRPRRHRALLWLTAFGLLGAAPAWALPGAPLGAKRAPAASADEAEVTFIGYQALSGGRSQIFVELTRAVDVAVSRSGSVVEYKLGSARVPLKNNENPLLLRDFASSALSAVLVPSRRAKGKSAKAEPPSVRLVITLRGNVQPTYRVTARGKGAVLEIELPPLAGS